MRLRQPDRALEATICLHARQLQGTRQLGGYQCFCCALPFDPVERGGIFDLFFKSLEAGDPGIVVWAKPTCVSDFVSYAEIVEGQVLAIILDGLFDNPCAVENGDRYS